MREAIGERQRLRAFLARFPAHEESVRELDWLTALSAVEFGEAVGNVVNGLRPLCGAEVLRVSEQRGFGLRLLAEEPALLIVGSPAAGGQTAEVAAALSVALAAQRWLHCSTRPRVPLLLMLPEAQRIQERVRLTTLLSLGASVGLAAVLGAQSMTQFDEAERDEILFNCATMILLPGVGAPTTGELARRLGQRSALGLSSSVQRGRPWDPPQHGLSATNQTVPMLGHREISMPPFEGRPAIVHAATLHPQPLLVDMTREDL